MESPLAYRVGDWELHPAACRLVRDGAEVKLSPRSTDVLVYLVDHAGQVVTHDELLNRFWRGPVSSPNAVHKSIAELRHAFGNGNGQDRYIETVPKRGYRLLAPVQRLHSIATGTGAGRDSLQPATPSLPEMLGSNEGRGSKRGPAKHVFRRVMLVSGVAAVALAAALKAWIPSPQTTLEARIISLKDRSAVLLPTPEVDREQGDREMIATVLDGAVARLGLRPGQTTLATRPPAIESNQPANAAAGWGVDYAVSLDVTGTAENLRATLVITPNASDLPSHREYFEYPRNEHTRLADALISDLSEDLRILLDDEHVRRMREWGTTSVHAYRLARRADSFQGIGTVESQNQAAVLFREALGQDPGFLYAYCSLSAVYQTIALIPSDTETSEGARQSMQALLRDARVNLQDEQALAMIEQRYQLLSAGSLYDSEALLRARLMKNSEDIEALDRYSILLMGGKLLDEAEAYRERAISLAKTREDQDAVESLATVYADFAAARGDLEKAIRLTRWNAERSPDFTLSLYGLVKQLSRAGRFPEAELYLSRLKATDPAWAVGAELLMRAIRGDIPAGSNQLKEALANPRLNNASRGDACFIVGEVECGVHNWRNIEPGFLPLIRRYSVSLENYFAPGVVMDPRYQALLEELGVGKKWREYMRARATELATVIGIDVTSPVPQEDEA